MGQAFRRATGRIGNSAVGTASQPQKPIQRPPPSSSVPLEGTSRVNTDNVLEDRDPQYDALLGQMVGRIQAKPGGKLEMGEASVVERYKRPMPKLRNTKPDSGRYEERPTPPGTLNVAQLRQIILLHQGKSDEHEGPLDASRIAERFRINVGQVQNILQFVSLPPEDDNKKQNNHE